MLPLHHPRRVRATLAVGAPRLEARCDSRQGAHYLQGDMGSLIKKRRKRMRKKKHKKLLKKTRWQRRQQGK